MVNKKLKEIGQKLNVSGKDVKKIQNTAFKEKLVRFLIHPILGVALSILTFIVGVSLGGGCANCAGYPFTTIGPAIVQGKKGESMLYILLIPIITLVAGYLVGKTFFSYAIMYNVYKR